MKKFFADWRNSALVVALAAIAILLAQIITSAGTVPATRIVRLSNGATVREITQKDVVEELKRRAGDQLVLSMVSQSLIELYAAKKGVSVSERDVDQVLNFRKTLFEMQGQDLEKSLQEQSVSLDEYRDNIRTEVRKAKLVIPQEELQTEVARLQKSKELPFTLPKRFRVRLMMFLTPESAEQAVAGLNSGKSTLEEVLLLTANAEAAQKTVMYAPDMGKSDPLIDKAIKGLKPGQCSKPFAIPGSEQARGVVQLVNAYPVQTPSMESMGIAIATYMLESNYEKYAPKLRELEEAAVTAIDVQFFSQEYKTAFERFQKFREQNPKIEGFTPGTKGAEEIIPMPQGKE